MFTTEKFQKIMLDLLAKDGIGCTYDFKERYDIGLNSLATLNLVKLIKTRIPKCGDHCQDYRDCKYLSLFDKRKSKTKYLLTKEGKNLATFLTSDAVSASNLTSMLQKELSNYSIVDLISSLLMDSKELTIERLVASLVKQTTMPLFEIRTSMRDILDLLVSLEIIAINEGVITSFA